MRKVNVTNYRLLQNKALGSIKICEELQGSLAGIPQPLPGCWLELCWAGKVTFMACLSLCEQYFALPWQNTAWWGSGGGISLTESDISCLWAAAVRERCDPRSLLCHCLGRMLENCSRGSGPCELLVFNSGHWERVAVCSKCSSGRGWWGSARLCSSITQSLSTSQHWE